MKKISILLVTTFICYYSVAQKTQISELSFLHTAGQDIVNEYGNKVRLRGVGLGNWFLPEGYMWKFGSLGDRPRKIEKLIANLIGDEKAAKFWKSYRQNYITEKDIQRIATLGFNAVRPALNARLFLTEGDNPVYVSEGFQLMDSLVSWCKKHRLYIIIDMHGAPGGQTGANIDDSPDDIPALFIDKKYQDRLVNLWSKIVKRYKNEPVIAAYDLLNEPLPKGSGAAGKYKHLLVPLYQRLTSEIRKTDQKHMITLEGFDWSNDWSLFDKPFDKNVFYQFHYYCWGRPDHLNSIDEYLIRREQLKTPIWVGETGEKGNTIYWATSQYFEANNIGFSFWPWKKMDTQNTPYSIKKPDNWDVLSAYTNNKGPKPGSVMAGKMFDELLENIKLAECNYFEDVTHAILNRIPGKVEAENYGFDGYERSYFVLDTAARSAYYRKQEPVKIVLDSKDKDQFWSEQSIELKTREWVVYQFESLQNKESHLTIRASSDDMGSAINILVNDKASDLHVISKELVELNVGNYQLKKGKNRIKILVRSNSLKLDWLRFN